MMAVMSETPSHAMPTGWYPDPDVTSTPRDRFWDGSSWTSRMRLGRVYPRRAHLGRGFFALAACLRWVLVAQVVLGALAAGIAVWTVSVLTRWLSLPETITAQEGHRIDVASATASGISAVLYLVTGVLFVVWLWKAYASDRVDPSRLRHGAGWAIGSWFVPILNLFRPYQIVRDLRRGILSGLGASGPDPRRHVVSLWWAAFLAMILTDSLVRGLARSGDTAQGLQLVEGLRTAAWADLASAVTTMVAAALGALLVRRLTAGLRPVEYVGRPAAAVPTVDAEPVG